MREWEQRRRQQAAEIEARRSIERRAASRRRIPAGYGVDGSLPAYVKAHVSELKASPFGEPVFSPGRRTYSVANSSSSLRRPRSRSPETRLRKCTSAGVSPSNASPGRRRHPCFGTVNRERDAGRPATAAGVRPWSRGQNTACSSPPVSSPQSAGGVLADIVASADTAARPVSAPDLPRSGRGKIVIMSASPSRPRCASSGGRRPLLSAAKKEARLLEKLNGLSSFQHRGEYPTVCALKTAFAIEAVQAQLREKRGGAEHRAATAPPSSSAQHSRKGTSSDSALPGGRHAVPWDNRSPYIQTESLVFPRTAQPSSGGRAKSAPALRTLTLNDPVFGNNTPHASCHGRRWSHSNSLSKTPRKVEAGLGFEEGELVPCPSTSFAAGEGERVTAARTLQEKFKQLTVGALVELNHLHSPPKPVLAVLAALACLLGLKASLCGVSNYSRRRRALLFSNAYVLRDVLASVCPCRIPCHRVSSLAKRLSVSEAAPARVTGASAAAAVLLEWLLAVVACARAEGVAAAAEAAAGGFERTRSPVEMENWAHLGGRGQGDYTVQTLRNRQMEV